MSYENQSEVAQLQGRINQSLDTLKLGKALSRLLANADFKTVILDEYFNKEAIRLVHLRSDPSQDTPAAQAKILKEMDGIGVLSSFLSTLEWKISQAEKALAADKEALVEVMGEE